MLDVEGAFEALAHRGDAPVRGSRGAVRICRLVLSAVCAFCVISPVGARATVGGNACIRATVLVFLGGGPNAPIPFWASTEMRQTPAGGVSDLRLRFEVQELTPGGWASFKTSGHRITAARRNAQGNGAIWGLSEAGYPIGAMLSRGVHLRAAAVLTGTCGHRRFVVSILDYLLPQVTRTQPGFQTEVVVYPNGHKQLVAADELLAEIADPAVVRSFGASIEGTGIFQTYIIRVQGNLLEAKALLARRAGIISVDVNGITTAA